MPTPFFVRSHTNLKPPFNYLFSLPSPPHITLLPSSALSACALLQAPQLRLHDSLLDIPNLYKYFSRRLHFVHVTYHLYLKKKIRKKEPPHLQIFFPPHHLITFLSLQLFRPSRLRLRLPSQSVFPHSRLSAISSATLYPLFF